MLLAQRAPAALATTRKVTHRRAAVRKPFVCKARASSAPEKVSAPMKDALLSAAGLTVPFVVFAQEALAKDGELGLLEGRTIALIHPAMEFSLLAISCYAGWLGLQWRRTRTIADDIKALKTQLPAATADSPAPPSPIAEQLAALEAERKTLIEGKFKDKHAVWGSVLLGAGILIAVEGCFNTFWRTGRLFPGPHLYAGAGICVLWALAAALVPAMQKGNETARGLHIALNTVQVALFLWQVPTGLEIVGKVFMFTSWP